MALSIKSIQDINKITDSLYKHAANGIKNFIKNKKINVACHSGCDTCCKTLRIEILPAEAFYLVAPYVRRVVQTYDINSYKE